MAWFLGQSASVIVAAFLLGLLAGWLCWGRRWPRSAPPAAPAAPAAPVAAEPAVGGPAVPLPEPVPVGSVEPVPVVPVPVEPVVVAPTVAGPAATGARPVEAASRPDDLERIEGIGPKMAGALLAAGIRTYRQLADADQQSLRVAIERAGLRFAPSLNTWARQARYLADGDETGFLELTDRLVAGRDVGRS